MSLRIYPRPVLAACLAVVAGASTIASAQQPPDSGTLQERQRQLPNLPSTGAPEIKTPPVRRAYAGGDIKVQPSGFRFTGNTLVSDAELQAVVAGLVGKEIDFNGLVDAAASLRQVYAVKGYVLTDVYFPEQAFSATGGVVEFAVIEARVGKVTVRVAPGSGVSQAYAEALAQTYLKPGAAISQYLLDRPVLLLRDMAGSDAEATVLPGTRTGEADVDISVTQHGKRYEPSVSLDNMGARSSGQYRVAAAVNVNAPLGMGDVLTARVQGGDMSGNLLYRLSYGMALGPFGTKATLSYTQSEYALGRQFESLGISGKAKVTSLSAVHPLIRGRFTNLFASGSLEHKSLADEAAQSATSTSKRVEMLRLGLLGNHSDRWLAGGTTSLALTWSGGNLALDATAAAADVGQAPNFGPRAAGGFQKLNLELQRVQYLSDRSSVLVGLTGQAASKNLTSAEKMSLGGPQGVRGYPIGEGIGDDGLLLSAEYRYRTGVQLWGEVLSVIAFYDYGVVQRDHVRNDTTQSTALNSANRLTLDALGLGVTVGREGNYVMSASVASRVGGPLPTTGDPDTRARLWLTLQKWF